MLTLKNINYSVGSKEVFSSLNLSINKNDRIGLVGPNGAGKSTLLKIIAGIFVPISGSIDNPEKRKVVYFPQEIPTEFIEKSIQDYLKSFGNDFEEHEISQALSRVGLKNLDLDTQIKTLSGGEKNKISLAAIMLSEADVILLDEPTNNLDLSGITLLEKTINSSNSAFVIVSHDRKLLKNVVRKIAFLPKGAAELKVFNAGYEEFLLFREKAHKEQEETYKLYLEERARLQKAYRAKKEESANVLKKKKRRDNDKGAFKSHVESAGVKHASAAESIKTRMERLEEVERPKKPLDLNYLFSENLQFLGGVVVNFNNAIFEYKNLKLGPFNFVIQRGDRVVILGDNGAGKTTLLKSLLGQIGGKSGSINIGTSVQFGLIDQEQTLPAPQKSALENFRILIDSPEGQDSKEEGRLREYLYAHGLGSAVDSLALELSPGERSRLILASLAKIGKNVLLFDEPTNHLDLDALEELEKALAEFKGTYIVVSHDREFIEKIKPNRKIEITRDGARELI